MRASIERYPAYFTYLVAHELGHAKIYLADLLLHVHASLIEAHIGEASDKKVTKWIQFPHEIKTDQFGIYIAERIHGKERLDEDILAILESGQDKDPDRLHYLMSLDGCSHFEGLREELVELSLPYRSELMAIWQREGAKSTQENPLLAETVRDPASLFEPSE